MLLRDMSFYKIGNTPLVKMDDIHGNRLFVKLEGENFLGSVKARTAYQMLRDLPELPADCRIIESTSGNLGYALGYFCKEIGREFLCLIDPLIAVRKKEQLEKNQIHYQLVERRNDMDYRSSRIDMARRMAKTRDYYWVNQYDNASAVKVHCETTGPEIWEQTGHEITHMIVPMGSCGTICGIAGFLKYQRKPVVMCGVEPFGSTIFDGVDAEYINVGAGLMGQPENLKRHPDAVDKSFKIQDEDSIACAKRLRDYYGLDVGITTGMAYAAALKLADTIEGAVIVILSPDSGVNYEEYLR